MEIKYDPKIDSLYLSLVKGRYEASRKVSDNVVVDFDKKNKVLGIEILSVKETMPSFVPHQASVKVRVPSLVDFRPNHRKACSWV